MRINRGILYGVTAYTIWGLLPIYWKLLQHVPADEILANRIIWSCLFVGLVLTLRGNWQWLKPALHQRKLILTFAVSASLLGLNWFIYIWAVNAGYVIETSLGYFINPLLSVLLGVVFLRERLRLGQAAALSLAVAGVAYLTFGYGSFPWIALSLAVTFGVYGLLRKTAALPSTSGLFLETSLLVVPALLYLMVLNRQGTLSIGQTDLRTTLLLIGVGIVTAVPLLLFGAAARRITLTNIGLLQYIAPTIQFLLGLFLFNEPFGQDQLIGFIFIWSALLIYAIEGIWISHRNRPIKSGSPA
ncbi:MAG: EamA family transporter RarD [Candidatus Promineifilaceae bacterium]|nr:EamA family transporter RarD [Candidatus Promineifilaceae bacterium]